MLGQYSNPRLLGQHSNPIVPRKMMQREIKAYANVCWYVQAKHIPKCAGMSKSSYFSAGMIKSSICINQCWYDQAAYRPKGAGIRYIY